MIKKLELTLPYEIGLDEVQLENYLKNTLKVEQDPFQLILKKRSIDARSKQIKVNLQAEVFINESKKSLIEYKRPKKLTDNAKTVIVIGFGPAGMFAAHRLIEFGIKPIVIERGSDVQARRRDLAAINKDQIVNPESNYCFGEGGAGTYSDGKLYTRSVKRGNLRKILEVFVDHGATDEILYDAHPHIGTNKLPKIVQDIRQTIIDCGGEVHFNTKVVDLIIDHKIIKGVELNNGKIIEAEATILATGHSARDVFQLLEKRKVKIEAKPFALGVRVEHQQSVIDQAQYHRTDRGKLLPAASYSLVTQVPYKGIEKGVFSFCMCPGGFIVPSATEQGEIVVNGMSPSRRDSKFANSGIVVSVDESDWKSFADYGNLAGLEYQKSFEKRACILGGNTQVAPAQLLQDFTQRKSSASLLETSYQPGIISIDFDDVLGESISHRLRNGFISFGSKIKGYLSNQAQIIGVESRTSSPVRVPRDAETCEHVDIKRLYPCGEGAGYAGGIVSAAMDGEKIVEALVKEYFKFL